ncbi:MAG: nucleoside hydrolase, partial [Bacteroidota bacterium]
ISTVFGNTDIDTATRIAEDLSGRFAMGEIPVYRGAAQAIDLQQPDHNEGVAAMAQALMREPMTIMAIGPATNIGLLLLHYPEVIDNIQAVLCVAGRRAHQDAFTVGPLHSPPFPDLNFDLDPEAFRIMLQEDIPLILLPFEISSKVWITGDDLNQLAETGPEGAYLAEHSQGWLKQWEEYGVRGFNPFDVLASAYLVQEDSFAEEVLAARIEVHPDDTDERGTAFKPYLLVGKSQDNILGWVRYVYSPARNFKQKLLEVFRK